MPAAHVAAQPIRVVIADDHPVVRRGLRALLQTLAGIEVVGEAGDGDTAITEVAAHAPDVILMDLHMPGTTGIEATKRIVASGAHTAVLVLTMFDDDSTVLTAIQAGARGYLLKGADQDEIGRALQAGGVGRGDLQPGRGRRGPGCGRTCRTGGGRRQFPGTEPPRTRNPATARRRPPHLGDRIGVVPLPEDGQQHAHVDLRQTRRRQPR